MPSLLTATDRIRLRAELYETQNGVCVYCFTRMDENTCTLDHVRPLDAGGKDDRSNLVVACPECNQHKRNANVETFVPELAEYREDHRRFVREQSRKRREQRFTNRPFSGLSALLLGNG